MDTNIAADSLIARVERLLRSPLVRLLGIGGLALVLQVSVLFIGDLVRDRRSTRDAAVAELTSIWGGA